MPRPKKRVAKGPADVLKLLPDAVAMLERLREGAGEHDGDVLDSTLWILRLYQEVGADMLSHTEFIDQELQRVEGLLPVVIAILRRQNARLLFETDSALALRMEEKALDICRSPVEGPPPPPPTDAAEMLGGHVYDIDPELAEVERLARESDADGPA